MFGVDHNGIDNVNGLVYAQKNKAAFLFVGWVYTYTCMMEEKHEV